MYRDRRKSFIEHPDAMHFRRKFCERVFQQLQAITPTTDISLGEMAAVLQGYAPSDRDMPAVASRFRSIHTASDWLHGRFG
jgi:hypothetical protein